MSDLIRFRGQIDEFMEHHPQSPLGYDQKVNFTGLKYYPEDEAFIIESKVERFPADEPLIEMETSTGTNGRIAAGVFFNLLLLDRKLP